MLRLLAIPFSVFSGSSIAPCGVTAPTVLASQLGASAEIAVAPAVDPSTPVQATGPSGVHPKNWLITGV